MDYEILLSSLQGKIGEFENLLSKASSMTEEGKSELNIMNGTEISSLYSSTTASLDRLKSGYQTCSNWLNEYLSGLNDLESSLANFSCSNIDSPTEFKGEFIDLFGKKVIPILKSNATEEDKNSLLELGVKSSSRGSADAEEMIQKVLETLGSAYVYYGYNWVGTPEGSEFTCSGLVDYGLGRPSQTDNPESLRDEIGRENITTDVSQLKRGDLVFYEFYGEGHDDGWGHVGIYLGDGQIIHAWPDGGVQISGVYDPGVFLGGGTLI